MRYNRGRATRRDRDQLVHVSLSWKLILVSLEEKSVATPVMNRDENAAHHILSRYLDRPGPHIERRGILHEEQSSGEVTGASCALRMQQSTGFHPF